MAKTAKDKRIMVSPENYLKIELEEMFGSKNRWYACEKRGFPLDRDLIVLHYIENGGADNFAKRYRVEESRLKRVIWHTIHPLFMLKRCFRKTVLYVNDKTGLPAKKALRLCRMIS